MTKATDIARVERMRHAVDSDFSVAKVIDEAEREYKSRFRQRRQLAKELQVELIASARRIDGAFETFRDELPVLLAVAGKLAQLVGVGGTAVLSQAALKRALGDRLGRDLFSVFRASSCGRLVLNSAGPPLTTVYSKVLEDQVAKLVEMEFPTRRSATNGRGSSEA